MQLAGYKVKCMLAEPKGKRSRNEASGFSDPASPVYQVCSSLCATADVDGTAHHLQLLTLVISLISFRADWIAGSLLL